MMVLSWVLVGILLLVLYIYYRYVYTPYQILKRCGIKGPPPIPFYGNYAEIRKKGILEFEKSIFDEYGSVCGYYVGKKPIVMVVEPDMIGDITVKEFRHFKDRMEIPNFIKDVFPKGLLFSKGQEWKRKRQTVSPTFSPAKVKSMSLLSECSVKTLVEVMGNNVDTGKSIDIFRTFGSFTMETILATAYGRRIEVQKGEFNSLTEAAGSLFEKSSSAYFLISLMSNFPWLDSILGYFIKPSIGFKVLNSSAIDLIQARREEGRKGEEGRKDKDLLQLMMDATLEEREEEEDSNCPLNSSPSQCNKLTNDDIAGLAAGFLMAGYETTATTLTYTTYLLALNPDIQEKLQEEIETYFEDNPEASLYKAANDIGYLDMVIMESMRLLPVTSQVVRLCSETITIRGVLIPEDALVVIPTHLLHNDARFWPNPSKFDPMRFSPEEKAKRPSLSYVPFGSGPRNCVGRRFALLEAKIALIELLKKFTFLKAPDTEVRVKLLI